MSDTSPTDMPPRDRCLCPVLPLGPFMTRLQGHGLQQGLGLRGGGLSQRDNVPTECQRVAWTNGAAGARGHPGLRWTRGPSPPSPREDVRAILSSHVGHGPFASQMAHQSPSCQLGSKLWWQQDPGKVDAGTSAQAHHGALPCSNTTNGSWPFGGGGPAGAVARPSGDHRSHGSLCPTLGKPHVSSC